MSQKSCLTNRCLCLNKSWQPVTVRNVVKCLKKVFSEKAKIVDPHTYQMYTWEEWLEIPVDDENKCIRAIDLAINIPEVIVLTEYNKIPKVSVTFNRRNIYLRDNNTCQYCGVELERPDITLDHVIPRAQGGTSTWENCVVACFKCNSKKRDRTPKEAGMKLLTVPKKPRWVPSFHDGVILDSWEKFLSDVYWGTRLKEK